LQFPGPSFAQVAHIASFLAYDGNPNLVTLTLRSAGIDATKAGILASALKVNTKLQFLS